jgi:hypothetical protein
VALALHALSVRIIKYPTPGFLDQPSVCRFCTTKHPPYEPTHLIVHTAGVAHQTEGGFKSTEKAAAVAGEASKPVQRERKKKGGNKREREREKTPKPESPFSSPYLYGTEAESKVSASG